MTLHSRTAAALGTGWRDHIEEDIFLLNIVLLCLATFPAISPIADKEFETESINLHAWLETDAKIPVVHLILVGVGEEQGKVACDGEEKIGQIRKLIYQHLGNRLSALTLSSNAVLGSLGKELIWQLTEPGLEHGANDVNIIEIIFLKQIDIIFCTRLAKPKLSTQGIHHYLDQICAATF